jgi:hypothetical protein
MADLDGGGIADVIIGAPGAAPGGLAAAGSVFVISGKKTGWTTPFALAGLNGDSGYRFNSPNAGEHLGSSLAVGDINGDLIYDLIIGAPDASPGGHTAAGSTYLVYGRTAPREAEWSLAHLNGLSGFRLDGIADNDNSGFSVAAGDINANGKAEIVIGAPGASPSARSQAGSSYVFFGAAVSGVASRSLSTLNGTNGFEFDGSANDGAGRYVAAGDMNGDGTDDIMTGAYTASPGGHASAGSTFIYFGKRSGGWTSPYDLSSLCSGGGC